MTKIYLCRHGETEWNVVKRMQGQNNSNLTELGVSQAKALGKRLEDIDIDIIYSSSCQRALDTAMHVRGSRDLQIIAEDDLREINLGNWEGLLFSEAEERNPVQFDNFWHHPELYVPDGGETFQELQKRASTIFEDIAKKHPNGTVLVVAHGIVIKTLYVYFRNQPISEIVNSPYTRSACLCEVVKENGVWNVMNWNDTEHYSFIGQK